MVAGNIPDDVMKDILLRIPTKSIVRFRCVHKSWNFLFKSSSFIANHSKNFNNNFLLIDYFKNSSSGRQWSIRFLTHDTFNVYLDDVELPFKTKRGFCHIVGSCNGLVCFDDYIDTGHIFLYNPFLNQHKTLPQPYQVPYEDRVIGFGYDSVNNDYKVVFWYKEYNGALGYSNQFAQVYSLGMNCWRKVETPYHYYITPSFGNDSQRKAAVFLNGGIHWLGYSRRNPDLKGVICFNVSSEEVQWFLLPDYVKGLDMKISVYKDLLCLVNSRWNGCYYDMIWVMSKYGVQESWTRLHTLQRASSDYDARFLRGILMNGELLWENINYDGGSDHSCLTVDYPDDGNSKKY
ncbi:hypothetical protein COLO4_11924 [Corchorus olitorius]|uniref:F-box domain-containing protein n=1 Tax=Corchorus olitorius TaxID=93759 RepID=A0A1R3K2Q9_9ROSI|nr:hypothetical protein COLO4_11924 [Corchorus olitorius]